ncbi:YeeE/YedE thiosulfate transporter family protein [Sporohalobacter salinus]|uniref:YeeE/YedE thiosulfate transporter family protein n=1 Tax=Sporohalobacter salinus TaxID=1494606 RepID=UPI00195F5F13|nr:YeeE/YedE thiosulfate transporter family protein [Sporohalobacter salinus]MBM7622473.1 xanthosine utilization system XapX-like protein [Sporohalobacter salinus]
MLTDLHNKDRLQLFFGLTMGIIFGGLLQKGGLTNYQVIIGQLLLRDFTMFKVVSSAIITGMIGTYFLKGEGLVEIHPGSGSLWTAVFGGLIFGVGFGILGYCPGTAVGAFGTGAIDGLFGILGIIVGAWLFSLIYPLINDTFLTKEEFDQLTIPEMLGINHWLVIVLVVVILISVLGLIEKMGL